MDELVSKQAVLDLCDMRDRYEIPYEYDEDGKHIKGYDEGRIIDVTKLKMLPPVTPQPKTGHWIEHIHNGILHIECSECLSWFLRSHLLRNSFCPNCGAKMVEE